MTRAKLAVFITSLLVTGAPLLAHHSFVAEFDINAPVTLTGVVTKVEWTNPHTYSHVDVTDQTGSVVSWICQTGSPNSLENRGWKRGYLKAGDAVTFRAYRAKAGTNFANARSVLLPDSRWVFVGSSGDFGPER
jgi:hypothetical protein